MPERLSTNRKFQSSLDCIVRAWREKETDTERDRVTETEMKRERDTKRGREQGNYVSDKD